MGFFGTIFAGFMIIFISIAVLGAFHAEKAIREKEWCEDNRVIEIEPGIEVIVKCEKEGV